MIVANIIKIRENRHSIISQKFAELIGKNEVIRHDAFVRNRSYFFQVEFNKQFHTSQYYYEVFPLLLLLVLLSPAWTICFNSTCSHFIGTKDFLLFAVSYNK